ncbi:MAG: AraC family transcriptional regulator [Bacteroidales bacterium]|nr:AraC family transcriptional regulator [Bacteroidales bacterium]
MSKVITEITPLSEKDCFYLVDRHKTEFDYPIHRHEEYELNFVSNCKGARRVVGDSIEELNDFDLALVGPGLEHCWEHANCGKGDKREITIQFSPQLLGQEFLKKNQMRTISRLFENAKKGIAFEMLAIMKVYSMLDDLTHSTSDFIRLLRLLEIFYQLSLTEDWHALSSSSFANAKISQESRRVGKVEDVINKKYRENITLEELAEVAGMTPTAFSRFFRQRTGRTLSEYIIDIRLGHAARSLVDTTMTISEICYDSGFNNISNFNRAFKRKKGCTPKTFRENYLKTKVIV